MENNAAALILAGLRFEPSDLTLMCYLMSKVTGKSTLHLNQDYVKDFDLYGEKEPWEIWDLFDGNNLRSAADDLYIFARLKKKSQDIDRSIGTGTWVAENSGQSITYSKMPGQPLGFKKRFRYEGGVQQQMGQWIMDEHSLNTDLVPGNDDHGYVLCRLRKNDTEKKEAEE